MGRGGGRGMEPGLREPAKSLELMLKQVLAGWSLVPSVGVRVCPQAQVWTSIRDGTKGPL